MSKLKYTYLLLALLIFCLGFKLYRQTYLIMGTFVEIVLPPPTDSSTTQILEDTVERMRSLEDILSIYKKESFINKLNSLKKDEIVKVPKEIYETVEKSIQISRITEGAFDITVSPILKLWHFEGGKLRQIPKKEEIEKARTRVGWEKIILTSQGEVGFAVDHVSINLGGIAKGYIVDKAIMYLKEKGIRSALINAGGDMYCLGKKRKGEPWQIGIRHPRKKNAIIGVVKLYDKAIATSGDYEKFFTLHGKRFSHIINPSTGYPVDNNVIQATVIAPICADADALATALMVMGTEKGLRLIEGLKDTEAVMIEEDKMGKLLIHYTSGLQNSIEIYE